MPRKILLSFLGTNNYDPVSYYIERSAELPPLEKYVQKTILNHLAASFGPTDQAYIFLTEQARAANWEDDGHYDYNKQETISNTGLARQIEAEAYHFGVSPVEVNDQSEPEAIWETFETVYACLQSGDEVYLDITHSWRYLPMLGMTLLNYAKVLKDIQVKAIYYGAFEQLGTSFEVRKMPLDQRRVPILDLVSFSELQDWTIAADDFVQDGNPTRLATLTQRNLSGILQETNGQDQVARNMSDLTRRLNQLVPLITTNRGGEIWSFDFQGLQQTLHMFSRENSYVKALNGVMQHVQDKLEGFQAEGTFQWLEAVRWCIQHGLVQQGITQLQEGLVSWLCLHYEQKQWAEPGYFDMHKNGRGRDIITKALQFIGNAPPEEKWRGAIGRRPELGYRLMEDPLARSLSAPFIKLVDARNDINHGGYIEEKMKKANRFYKVLEDCFAEINEILAAYYPKKTTGLLNLSNHPSDRWSETQKSTAIEQYEAITDLPFPNIDPGLSNSELDELVSEYFDKVMATQPTAVHLMGEMTFTHALVQKLKAAGIPCVASTSQRLSEELPDGT
jgi:CRISPR-associated Csx2 family protein